jgi:hypothetical protein
VGGQLGGLFKEESHASRLIHSSASLAAQIKTSPSIAGAIGVASRNIITPEVCAFHVLGEMRRHRPAILADKNSPGVRGHPQDFRIFQTCKTGIGRSANVRFQALLVATHAAPVQVGVSLESDSHAVPAAAWRLFGVRLSRVPMSRRLRRAAFPSGRRDFFPLPQVKCKRTVHCSGVRPGQRPHVHLERLSNARSSRGEAEWGEGASVETTERM